MATSGKRRAAAAVEQVDGQDMPRLGFIAADPVDKRLTIDGAITMIDGSKLDVDAYADLMTAFANEPLPEDHADSGHPGVRLGEHIPKGLRVWDDVYAGASGKDGAGWISTLTSKKSGKKEKWFNIRSVGSWRMAFLLARLQREAWERFGDKAPLKASGSALLHDGTADLSLPDATPQATRSAVDPSLPQVSPDRTPKRKKCDATSSPLKKVKRDTLAAGPVLAPFAKEHDEHDRTGYIDWQQISDQCRKSKENDRRRKSARQTGATNTGPPDGDNQDCVRSTELTLPSTILRATAAPIGVAALGPSASDDAMDVSTTGNLQPRTLTPSPSPSLQMPAPGTKMSAMLERIRAREAALKVASAQDQ